jgi:hypothetical protein
METNLGAYVIPAILAISSLPAPPPTKEEDDNDGV